MVLLQGLSDESVEERNNNGEEGLLLVFYSIERWSTDLTINNRLSWIRCLGIPLQVCGSDCFSKVVNIYKNFVKAAKETEILENIEFARLLVRVSSLSFINRCDKIRINNIICWIKEMEDTRGKKTSVTAGDGRIMKTP